jgi:hypothetical protein
MTSHGSEPTLGEVVRTLERIESEFGRRLDEIGSRFERTVAADVYEAHRQAMATQITDAVKEVGELREELAKEKTERRADRRVIVGAVLSLVVVVLGAALLTALNLK